MRKRGFTILEMVIVLILIGLVLGFSKNFLNTNRQQKTIFGETCVNYLFAEMQKFNSDVQLSKNTVSELSGQKVVKTTSMLYGSSTFSHSGTQNMRSTFIAAIYDASGNSSQTNLNFGPSFRTQFGEPATQCKSDKFTIGVQGKPFGDICKTHTDAGTDISDDCAGSTPITGESIINVCDLLTVSTTNEGTANKCIEIAKIILDKRQDDYFYLKCVKTNPITGICSQRPKVN